MASVVILEDDEISARLAARMLRMNGHEAHIAPKSDVAWARLQDSGVDMMLLDTQLDGELGWEVLAVIRQDVLFRELPVIVFSSMAQREVIQRYLTLGVQGILVKPATAERLNQEVDRVTAKPWRKKLFESEEAVQARTGLMPAELQRLYVEAAGQLRAAIPELDGLPDDLTNASGLTRLTTLKSCAINVGYLRLAQMVEKAQAAVSAADAEGVRRVIQRMPAALRMLMIHAGIDDSEVAATAEAREGEAAASSV